MKYKIQLKPRQDGAQFVSSHHLFQVKHLQHINTEGSGSAWPKAFNRKPCKLMWRSYILHCSVFTLCTRCWEKGFSNIQHLDLVQRCMNSHFEGLQSRRQAFLAQLSKRANYHRQADKVELHKSKCIDLWEITIKMSLVGGVEMVQIHENLPVCFCWICSAFYTADYNLID